MTSGNSASSLANSSSADAIESKLGAVAGMLRKVMDVKSEESMRR